MQDNSRGTSRRPFPSRPLAKGEGSLWNWVIAVAGFAAIAGMLTWVAVTTN